MILKGKEFRENFFDIVVIHHTTGFAGGVHSQHWVADVHPADVDLPGEDIAQGGAPHHIAAVNEFLTGDTG